MEAEPRKRLWIYPIIGVIAIIIVMITTNKTRADYTRGHEQDRMKRKQDAIDMQIKYKMYTYQIGARIKIRGTLVQGTVTKAYYEDNVEMYEIVYMSISGLKRDSVEAFILE